MKKGFFVVFYFVFSSHLIAQNLNDYKYAMIPSTFSFLKEKDQYRLNTLTKMLMEKYGFESYFNTDLLPDEFAKENCNKVFVDIEENNSFFISKLKVVLKDCKNNILFISGEGKSREKDYKVAYTQALREAFKSFDELNHKYSPSEKNQEMIGKSEQNKVVTEVKTTPQIRNESIQSNTNSLNQLFAQPISNGYQLINSEPKVIYKIYATSVKNYFIAKKGNEQGVFFLKDKEWFFEYYKDDKLISEKVNVTF